MWAGYASSLVLAGQAKISRQRIGLDREIHGFGGLVHGMKNLGPRRAVTTFHGSESESGSS